MRGSTAIGVTMKQRLDAFYYLMESTVAITQWGLEKWLVMTHLQIARARMFSLPGACMHSSGITLRGPCQDGAGWPGLGRICGPIAGGH